MKCQNCRSAIASARYAYGVGALRRITVLCNRCRDTLTGIGMDLRVERRAEALPADSRPAWMRSLRGKDFSGTVA